MGMFSLDENPDYIELEYKQKLYKKVIFQIDNIISNNILTDKEKINMIKEEIHHA